MKGSSKVREKIRDFAINIIVNTLLSSLSADQISREINRALDRLEELILDSSNTLDDSLLPALEMLRQAVNPKGNDHESNV